MIAVTGATGFVGQTLLDAATEQGIAVRALTRKPQEPRDGVKWIMGDLADQAALAVLMHGAKALIHVAGVTTALDQVGFEAGNVTGTLNVIEAAKAAGVQRFVFVSSLSAREPLLSQYGASKARAEVLVKESQLDWTIVRPPSIYGPRDDAFLEMFRMAAWGVVPVPPAGHSSIIHVVDLCRLLLALVPPGEAVTGHQFEPDDDKPGGWSHDELARAIAAAVGKRRPFVLHLKRHWMGRAARLDMRLRGSKAKLTLDRVGYMTHPDWVVSEAAEVPGKLWVPRIETREGLKATAAWYRAKGLL